jgi:peptidoglycan/xylan/chitin deacetylase (PgdA/CDA1 family)
MKRMARWTLQQSMEAGLLDFGDHRLVAIVRFHSVSDARDANHLYVNAGIAVTPETFERQVAFLAAQYCCLRMDDVAEAVESGRPLPRNALVVTFDDGYRDNYEHALPILRRHGVPAMFYVVSGCVAEGRPLWTAALRSAVHRATARRLDDPAAARSYDLSSSLGREVAIAGLKEQLVAMPRRQREDTLAEIVARCAPEGPTPRVMLDWDEIRVMRANGMDVGAHTVSHPRLPVLPPAEAAAEIRESREQLAAGLGEPIEHFSYPNPAKGLHVDSAVRRLVVGAGYRTAVTSAAGYVRSGDDRFELHRLVVGARPWDVAWDVERPALGDTVWTAVAGRPDAGVPRAADEDDASADMRIRRLRAAHIAAIAQAGANGNRMIERLLRQSAEAVSELRSTFDTGEEA